jgi:hypothetical protein
MLRRWGGSSHVIQANTPPLGVELPGLVATGHCWPTLATFPPATCWEFWQLFPHEHGLARVGFSFCFHSLHRFLTEHSTITAHAPHEAAYYDLC